MLQSGFMKGCRGHILLQASTVPQSEHAVLILPPFAEEMNKSRHIISQLMQQNKQAGISSFMLDHYGTGDSEGDLDLATTDIWRQDLQLLLAQLQTAGFSRLSVVAIRFGAMQLFDLLNHQPLALQLDKVVLWQPLLDISRFWLQLYRLKITEQMALGQKLTQAELEQSLQQDNTLEIAGYPISKAFSESTRQLNIQPPAILATASNCWFEISQLPNVAATTQKAVTHYQQSFPLSFQHISNAPFWNTQELATADNLINATRQFLEPQHV